MWEKVKLEKISVFKKAISSGDLKDFYEMAYNYWLSYRNTPYFIALVNADVDYLFNRYGNSPLSTILSDAGVKKEMLIEDIMQQAPLVINALEEKGLLAGIFRRRLEPFFLAETTLALL